MLLGSLSSVVVHPNRFIVWRHELRFNTRYSMMYIFHAMEYHTSIFSITTIAHTHLSFHLNWIYIQQYPTGHHSSIWNIIYLRLRLPKLNISWRGFFVFFQLKRWNDCMISLASQTAMRIKYWFNSILFPK